MKYFDLEFATPKQQQEVQREALAACTGQLAANGYMLTSQSEVAITYHRKYRHWGPQSRKTIRRAEVCLWKLVPRCFVPGSV